MRITTITLVILWALFASTLASAEKSRVYQMDVGFNMTVKWHRGYKADQNGEMVEIFTLPVSSGLHKAKPKRVYKHHFDNWVESVSPWYEPSPGKGEHLDGVILTNIYGAGG